MIVTNEAPRRWRDRTGPAVTQAAEFVAIHASMMAWEAAAVQEGRLELLAAAMAAGLDIRVFGWQAINLI